MSDHLRSILIGALTFLLFLGLPAAIVTQHWAETEPERAVVSAGQRLLELEGGQFSSTEWVEERGVPASAVSQTPAFPEEAMEQKLARAEAALQPFREKAGDLSPWTPMDPAAGAMDEGALAEEPLASALPDNAPYERFGSAQEGVDPMAPNASDEPLQSPVLTMNDDWYVAQAAREGSLDWTNRDNDLSVEEGLLAYHGGEEAARNLPPVQGMARYSYQFGAYNEVPEKYARFYDYMERMSQGFPDTLEPGEEGIARPAFDAFSAPEVQGEEAFLRPSETPVPGALEAIKPSDVPNAAPETAATTPAAPTPPLPDVGPDPFSMRNQAWYDLNRTAGGSGPVRPGIGSVEDVIRSGEGIESILTPTFQFEEGFEREEPSIFDEDSEELPLGLNIFAGLE